MDAMLIFGLVVVVVAAFFTGYSYARYHHHRFLSEGFFYLGRVQKLEQREPDEKDIVHAFGGSNLHRTLRP